MTKIDAGGTHTCALLADQTMHCWGEDNRGQLGLGPGDDQFMFPVTYADTLVDLGGPVADLALGHQHTCVRLMDNTIRCWGRNSSGSLGLGHDIWIGDDEDITPANTTVEFGPGQIAGLHGGGSFFTCAEMLGGGLRCFGANSWGQLGLGHADAIGDDELPSPELTTSTLNPLATFTGIELGYGHVCVRLTSGTLRCWGNGQYGELGTGNTNRVGDDETLFALLPVPLL